MDKPKIISQLPRDEGAGVQGGMKTGASAPKVNQGTGSRFVSVQTALLQHLNPDSKALSGNGTSSRQFRSLNAAGKVPAPAKKGSVKKIRKVVL